jgi:hypothetical protein
MLIFGAAAAVPTLTDVTPTPTKLDVVEALPDDILPTTVKVLELPGVIWK